MVTAPTSGYIYLLEAAGDLGAKTNWITTGAGNPDTIDVDQFTEGLTLCKFINPLKHVKRGKTGIIPSTTSGGITGLHRTANKFYNSIIMGKTETRAAGYLIEKFLFNNRHIAVSIITFKDYYLVIYYGSGDHEPFTNVAGTVLSYAPGVVSDWEIGWSETTHTNLNVRLNWWSFFES